MHQAEYCNDPVTNPKWPLNGTFELAGPERIRQDELVRQFLTATGDARTVITDPKALYSGITVNDQSLIPGDNPRIGPQTSVETCERKSTFCNH